MKQKKEAKIKAIIFDVSGVLKVRKKRFFRMPWEESFHTYIAKKLQKGLDSWFDSIDSVVQGSMEGKIGDKDTVKRVANNLGISIKNLLKVSDYIYKKLYKKNQKLYKTASELKKKGYIIGILSDQWTFSKRILTPKKDIRGFDPAIISCDVGMRKPDIRIYKLLIKKLRTKIKGLKYSEVIFIDNRDYNLKPAKKLGMKVILFKDNKQCIKELKKKGVS